MAKYVLKRILILIPVLLVVSFTIFTILYFTPGDPVQMMAPDASEEELQVMRENLGLHLGYMGQLKNFMVNTFVKFDLGTSYVNQIDVFGEIMTRFPRTLVLAFALLVAEVFIGIPLGITAASHQNGWQDTVTMVLAMVGNSVPGFWFALNLMLVFSLWLGWFPAFGVTTWRGWVLPIMAQMLTHIGSIARQSRSSMLEVIKSDYVTTARMKGLSERDIRYKHALPNALIPIITNLGMHLGNAIGGTVFIETVFTIPGVGLFMVESINNRDYPCIRGGVLILSMMFSVIMLLVDLIYAFVDPRIKQQYQEQSKKRLKKNG